MYNRVLLVNSPYYLRGQTTFKYIEGFTIPIGIMSLAAVVQRDLPEVNIRIIDGLAENLSPERLLAKIIEFEPELVGISCFTFNINDAFLLSKWIKTVNPGIKIMLGGVHVTQMPMEAMAEPNVDFVICGEAEYSFRDFVKGTDFSKIAGLVYRNFNNKIIASKDLPIIDDLNGLPLLSYDLIQMDKYFPTAGQCHKFPVGTIISSRGCPGQCVFCSSSVTSKKIRCKTAKNIVKEIKYLVSNYGVKEVVFMDDIFTVDKSRVYEFCQILKDEKIDILWDCSTRVQFVDENLLKTMKASGCSQISFGVESGDENILKSIKKGQTLEQVRKTILLSKKAGLETRGSFILGFPDDTIASMQKTIDLAIELDPHLVSFYVACPYPGTQMYDWALNNKRLLTTNWSYYDQTHHIMDIPNVSLEELDKMYKRAYSLFYHRLSYILKRVSMLKSFYDIRNAMRAIFMTINAQAKIEDKYDKIKSMVDRKYKEFLPK